MLLSFDEEGTITTAKATSVNEHVLVRDLRAAADQCVRCGLCLPHCPTYRERRDEAESPRGRIALIQGWVAGQIAASPPLRAHLDSCLEVRACEAVCPSLVRFGRLMDDARALDIQRGGLAKRLSRYAWINLLSSPTGARAAAVLAAVYRAVGAARLATSSGLTKQPLPGALHRLALQIKRPATLPPQPPWDSCASEEVSLFLGCIGQAAQPEAIEAAVKVLDRLGLRIRIPENQGCCGAMHRHNGLSHPADALLEHNAAAFNGRASVGIASACVAELRTHEALPAMQELCRFLADKRWPRDVQLRPLRERIAVHEPCSQRNMLRDPGAARDLLRRIPEIELVPLRDNAFCCGAAGTYLLQHPRMSQTLLAPKLAQLAHLGVRALVTTNTGCALHFAAGIADAHLGIRVQHPIELIARQLSG